MLQKYKWAKIIINISLKNKFKLINNIIKHIILIMSFLLLFYGKCNDTCAFVENKISYTISLNLCLSLDGLLLK